jgi:hypothetical protein
VACATLRISPGAPKACATNLLLPFR